jgi:uncharacterized LabA/DUF88 family protein
MHRVAVFIDGSYLDHVLEGRTHGKRINYQKLVKSIVNKAGSDCEIIRIYYYHCLPYQDNPPTEEQRQRFSRAQRFFRAIQRTPRFEVRRGRLAYRGVDVEGKPIFEQKQIDLLLGIDLVLHTAKGKIDEAFLVAGDSDFIPAIRAVKSEGVVVYLVHGTNPHDDLLDEVDERIEITDEIIGSSILMI